jgi:amidase
LKAHANGQASRPSRAELQDLADDFRLALSDTDFDSGVVDLVEHVLALTDQIDALAPTPGIAPGRRDAGRRPSPDEDPLNAIVRWCDVQLDGVEGPLSGMRVALKDCIAVAGVPLTGGSTLLEGFVPSEDSTLARRLLEAGAQIVAIANMDCLAWSGGGDTSAYGPTLCPFDAQRTAGGSSGGSAAALHYDRVDGSFGCDQGGSVRLPAAFCGAIGLKPTFGLVPYTRILGIDQAIDHAGPMARTVRDVARLLDGSAGKDPGDPRQPDIVPSLRCVRAVEEAGDDLRQLRIAVVREGLDSDVIGVTDEVRAAFWEAIDRFAGLGAEISEVSVPAHLEAGKVNLGGAIEGMVALISGGGNGYQWRGRYWPELSRALVRNLESRAHEVSIPVKVMMLCGEYLRRRYGGAVYGTARNLHAGIRDAYTRALADADVLAMPTAPGLAHKLDPELSIHDRVLRGWDVIANTAPTNVTGHAAISLPAAEWNGLAVGVMLIGPHFADDRLLGIARTFEAVEGWKPLAPR